MDNHMTKLPRILFFCATVMPTLEEQLAAEKLAPMRISFRNARMVSDSSSLEQCDGVAGAVPKQYAKAYPTGEEAAKAFHEAREAQYEARAKAVAEAKMKVAGVVVKEAEAKVTKTTEAQTKADAEAKKAEKVAEDAKKKQATAAAGWTGNA